MENKIVEALSKLLPEDSQQEVATAVQEMINESEAKLEQQYNEQLEKAYADMSAEMKANDEKAEQGYQEAWNIIEDLRNRLDMQKSEFDVFLNSEYEEAYKALQVEQEKNKEIETNLYEEYDKKLQEMKEYMIDKVDQFLQFSGKEVYEQARRDIVNDPRMVEHKVTLDRVVETVAEYISDEDYTLATSKKLNEAQEQIDELNSKLRLVEARNIRLSTENTKLNESVEKNAKLLTEQAEQVKNEDRAERIEKAKQVQGKGQTVADEKLIREFDETAAEETKAEEPEAVLAEGLTPEDLEMWQTLAGIKKEASE